MLCATESAHKRIMYDKQRWFSQKINLCGVRLVNNDEKLTIFNHDAKTLCKITDFGREDDCIFYKYRMSKERCTGVLKNAAR